MGIVSEAEANEPRRLATESESEFEQRLERLWQGAVLLASHSM
jgi:hypothetical protein